MARRWLQGGALHLVIPSVALPYWHGVNSRDYDRACALAEKWIEGIEVGDTQAFVLGGDPSDITVEPQKTCVLVVRWIFADDGEELVQFAKSGEAVVSSEPSVTFMNNISEWVIINAAEDGRALDKQALAFLLPIGPVKVDTSYRERDENGAVVHVFRGL